MCHVDVGLKALSLWLVRKAQPWACQLCEHWGSYIEGTLGNCKQRLTFATRRSAYLLVTEALTLQHSFAILTPNEDTHSTWCLLAKHDIFTWGMSYPSLGCQYIKNIDITTVFFLALFKQPSEGRQILWIFTGPILVLWSFLSLHNFG